MRSDAFVPVNGNDAVYYKVCDVRGKRSNLDGKLEFSA